MAKSGYEMAALKRAGAYDNNGNTLWTTNGGSGTGPYYYDPENRMTNFNQRGSCGGSTALFRGSV